MSKFFADLSSKQMLLLPRKSSDSPEMYQRLCRVCVFRGLFAVGYRWSVCHQCECKLGFSKILTSLSQRKLQSLGRKDHSTENRRLQR